MLLHSRWYSTIFVVVVIHTTPHLLNCLSIENFTFLMQNKSPLQKSSLYFLLILDWVVVPGWLLEIMRNERYFSNTTFNQIRSTFIFRCTFTILIRTKINDWNGLVKFFLFDMKYLIRCRIAIVHLYLIKTYVLSEFLPHKYTTWNILSSTWIAIFMPLFDSISIYFLNWSEQIQEIMYMMSISFLKLIHFFAYMYWNYFEEKQVAWNVKRWKKKCNIAKL